jgi:hypothetical protein
MSFGQNEKAFDSARSIVADCIIPIR